VESERLSLTMRRMKTVYTIVSFERTPLIEIGERANAILALGSRHDETLSDHWTVKFSKDVPEDVASPTADDDIKAVMGDYWIEP
jgi:hypothetical protein